MDAFLISTGLVALAEIGDKTQLLAFVLAARFRRSVPIVLGILAATLLNHALAGALGTWVTRTVDPTILRWVLAFSFVAMALWALFPDRLDGDPEAKDGVHTGLGVFWVTAVAFFFAEMGDKTQIATVALAARFDAPLTVVIGTTLGMLIANVPAVVVGHKLADRLPLRVVRGVAAAMFLALAVAAIVTGD